MEIEHNLTHEKNNWDLVDENTYRMQLISDDATIMVNVDRRTGKVTLSYTDMALVETLDDRHNPVDLYKLINNTLYQLSQTAEV